MRIWGGPGEQEHRLEQTARQEKLCRPGVSQTSSEDLALATWTIQVTLVSQKESLHLMPAQRFGPDNFSCLSVYLRSAFLKQALRGAFAGPAVLLGLGRSAGGAAPLQTQCVLLIACNDTPTCFLR